MAEALLAKDHFYVNASYYNDTNEDQDAVTVSRTTLTFWNGAKGGLCTLPDSRVTV